MLSAPVTDEPQGSDDDATAARTDVRAAVARPDRRLVLLLGLLVVVLAGGLRFVDLDRVDRLHFDEKYYGNDAHDFVEQGVEEKRPAHPPVGKLVMAVGILAFGFDPFGWRVGVALAGTLTVLGVYVAGLLLLRRPLLAAAAAALVALDGLSITMSRLAMLDAVLGLFVVWGTVLVLLHRHRHGSDPVAGRRPGGWELWAAGALFGLATATKWVGVLALLAGGLVALVVETRRRRGEAGPVRTVLVAGGSLVAPLLVVPVLVYVASYTPFLLNYTSSSVYARRCPSETCEAPVSERLAGLAFHHVDVARMHQSLPHTHPYRSEAWSWPVLIRPVLIYLDRCVDSEVEDCVDPSGVTARIVTVGNPALWWPAVAAVPVLGWWAWRRRDAAAAVVLLYLAALWLPWFVPESGYLFYMVPVVPFMALGLVLAADRLSRGRAWVPWVLVGASLAMFLYLAPIWYAVPLSPDGTSMRLLLSSWR